MSLLVKLRTTIPKGDINIDLLECNPVADRYQKLLEIHGCAQGIEEPTRVTLDSESLIDHIIHNDYQRPLEFGVIKTYITETILQPTLT